MGSARRAEPPRRRARWARPGRPAGGLRSGGLGCPPLPTPDSQEEAYAAMKPRAPSPDPFRGSHPFLGHSRFGCLLAV